MGRLQIAAVAVCIALNALDGFDVVAISFASPGIAQEWGINRAALGVVLSMEALGMAIGSLMLGNYADRFGRRPVILGCLLAMTVGMLASAFASTVAFLSSVRFLTGLGIGGMLASINDMVAEYSNRQRRDLSVSLMAAGYPIGIISGGSIAAVLLLSFDWRSVFLLGAAMTAIMLPLVWWLIPESISWLLHKRPASALQRINLTLNRMGHPTVNDLPAPAATPPKVGWRALFAPELAATTLILTSAYFGLVMSFYFMLKWIPKIVVDLGFDPAAAGSVLVWSSVGGATGALMIGWLSHRFRLRTLVVAVLLGGVVMVNVFGMGQTSLVALSSVAALAGFCINAAIVGMYALFVHAFPTHLRAGGTGFAIGFGRAGSAIGPILAGILFQIGFGLGVVAFVMSLGSLAAALLLLRMRDPQTSR